MGYELKMVFGTISQSSYKMYLANKEREKGIWVWEIGNVDLSKCGSTSPIYGLSELDTDLLPAMFYGSIKNRDFEVIPKIFSQDKETGHIEVVTTVRADEPFNEERDDEIITEDCYGSKMPLIDAYVALAALCQANKIEVRNDGETYRRFDIAIAALEAFIKSFDKTGSGHYGEHGEILVVYFYGH